ncbi:MAG: TIGR00730 family Rossman fold protein [Candidatus Marinarcus sp.]|uniref:LOG family protein n=1 Tax=Candidatus Marinarcus sp. TaxID=3100987 RepID=UPI003AFFA5D8
MNIAIYCGSSFGNKKIYTEATKKLARELSQRGINIVYGGSNQGLMGVVSDEAMAHNNKVIGVIPYSLVNKEIENKNISEIHKVQSMNHRKEKMEDLSDAFIAMPGGYGTLDEMFEVLSEAQLGKHKKACAFYNIDGYYDKLMEFLYGCVKNGFMNKRFVDMIIISDDPAVLVDKILAFTPVKNKWE